VADLNSKGSGGGGCNCCCYYYHYIIIIHFLSALVPDSVKKELLQKIKAYLVQDM